MRHLPAVMLSAVLIATPLVAQSKLDKAVEKARQQVEKGKPEDAVKTLANAAEEAGDEDRDVNFNFHELEPAESGQNEVNTGGNGDGSPTNVPSRMVELSDNTANGTI